MTNNEILKKKIIYRSTHRGTKEMDLLLGNFVNKYIDSLNDDDLKDLDFLISIKDEIIHKWYFDNDPIEDIPNTKISSLLKNFRF